MFAVHIMTIEKIYIYFYYEERVLIKGNIKRHNLIENVFFIKFSKLFSPMGKQLFSITEYYHFLPSIDYFRFLVQSPNFVRI